MYGFASGATARTSIREDLSLPIGIRTIAPRLTAEALSWFGASKCGSSRRYELTLEFISRQISSPCVKTRSTNCQAVRDIFSSPFGSQNRFFDPFETDTLVCIPLPFTPTTGFGRKLAVMPIWVATVRQTSL